MPPVNVSWYTRTLEGGGGAGSLSMWRHVYSSTLGSPLSNTEAHPRKMKGTVSRDFLLQDFSWIISSLKPPKITLGSFRTLSKVCEDIRYGKCALSVSTTPVANLPTGSMTALTALLGYSGAWGKRFMKKPWSRKSRGTVPLREEQILTYLFHFLALIKKKVIHELKSRLNYNTMPGKCTTYSYLHLYYLGNNELL